MLTLLRFIYRYTCNVSGVPRDSEQFRYAKADFLGVIYIHHRQPVLVGLSLASPLITLTSHADAGWQLPNPVEILFLMFDD